MNGCYKVVTRNLQWPAAGLECRRLHKDAHLLIINDAEEQSAVAEMLSSINRQYYFVFLIFFSHFPYYRSSDENKTAEQELQDKAVNLHSPDIYKTL